MPHPPRTTLAGLYVILDPDVLDGMPVRDACLRGIDGGARLFQYRDKRAAARVVYRQAEILREVCAGDGATLIINDRCDVALAVDAEGVHLGQDDLPLSMARRLLGPSKYIGISTHTVDQVREATAGGADYLGYGPIFPTPTKPDHQGVVGLRGLAEARAMTDRPIFAIGGIGLSNVRTVLEAGGDGVAIISAICAAEDIRSAVRAFMDAIAAAALPPPPR